MHCPLCGWDGAACRSSFAVHFERRVYEYHACGACGSLFCLPMPDNGTLSRMYGLAYGGACAPGVGVEDPKAPQKVMAVLGRRRRGVFLDFGCGSGSILEAARALGWQPIGVEFQADVARRVGAETQLPVLHGMDRLQADWTGRIDVVHVGDVIEHLPAPVDTLRSLVAVLAPGGWLVAQGPLEGGPCLYTAVLRAARRVRNAAPVDMPPYHVLQATVAGQRALFERAGLATVEYSVAEVAWPAPSRLSREVVRSFPLLGLFVLRKVSQSLSRLGAGSWGNRYFYVGMPHPSDRTPPD